MIPSDIFPRTRQLLLPFVGTVDDRDALITEAFFLHDPIVSNIALEGTPKTFCVKLIKQLIAHGCLTTDEHSLARLLTTLRYDCGVDKHPEIDELIAIMNGVCRDETPTEDDKPDPTPITSDPITIDTPKDERKPTIFISYSHADTEIAQKLIADLNKAGHACWIDTAKIKGGDEWIMTIAEGIINSYAFVPLVTLKALQSKWVQDEILWARQKNKLIIPLILENVLAEKRFFPLISYQGVTVFDSDYDTALAKLLSYLPNPTLADVDVSAEDLEGDETNEPIISREPRTIPRKLELAYMERLQFEELLNTEKYTAMGGTSQQMHQRAEIRAVFELLPMGDKREMQVEPEPFEDAVAEIQRIQRTVLLGEPGGGKTTTIWKLASDLVDKALTDRNAVIPILIRLGKWTDSTQPLHGFIVSQIGDLGAYLDDLLREKRVALLLDGLNEIPASQHKSKYPQVQAFIEAYPDLLAVVSCRELDYTIDLGFDRINITPLDPIRIREFVTKYLEKEQGDALFWKLAGGNAKEYENKFLQNFGEIQPYAKELFWNVDVKSKAGKLVLLESKWGDRNQIWYRWVKVRDNPNSLMRLARNPYMLLMLTSVFANQGKLPDNRGELFKEFVETLMERENVPEDEQEPLVNGLAQVAYKMQLQRISVDTSDGDAGNALTVLPEADVKRILGERLLYLSGSASILSVGEQVRFTHQLLQEYFAARQLDVERKNGLSAGELWSADDWWIPNNWNETAILLTGLYSDDASEIINWLADANPELTARCINESGANVPDDTLLTLRQNWLQHINYNTDAVIARGGRIELKPQARAGVGRALGQLTLSTGEMLDNRKGVTVIVKNGVNLPDIDWVTIPDDGEWVYQDDKHQPLSEFRISRYPITFAQFQTFIDDPEGYHSTTQDWFEGLASDADDRELREQYFKFSNHPRETVNWYQAMAFCRWFSWRLGGEYALDKVADWLVRLPTEFEWEKVARGTERLIYPYGNDFDKSKGNTSETGLNQTSVVGMFPQGASPYGILDTSGNVWEWCLTDYQNPSEKASDENISSNSLRVLRGGSWDNDHDFARSASRYYIIPNFRSSSLGFRLVSSPF